MTAGREFHVRDDISAEAGAANWAPPRDDRAIKRDAPGPLGENYGGEHGGDPGRFELFVVHPRAGLRGASDGERIHLRLDPGEDLGFNHWWHDLVLCASA